MKHFFKRIVDFIDSNKTELGEHKSAVQLEQLVALELPEQGVSDQVFAEFIEHYLHFSVNTSSPYYMNQLWSKVDQASILGEFMSAATNTSMYTYEVAPLATLMESRMIRHLGELIWPTVKGTGGIMTSGGTASNLQAVLTARNSVISECKQKGLKQQQDQWVIVAAKNAHYSVKRAANIIGLGHDHCIEIDCHANGVMILSDLEKKLDQLADSGKRPLCIISTAGSTVEGSFDDISAIGEIAKNRSIWFHLDGAMGGSVAISERYKTLLRGCESADSMTWDFHKMLGLNLPCAFLLIKNHSLLKESITTKNDQYLFHTDDHPLDLGPSSLQCGRRNDILKLWLTWLNKGQKGLAARVDRTFEIAREFTTLITQDDRFDLLFEPMSVHVCFRYKALKAYEFEALRERLIKNKLMMCNYFENQDGPYFRAVFTNPELETEHLKHFLNAIDREYRSLSEGHH